MEVASNLFALIQVGPNEVTEVSGAWRNGRNAPGNLDMPVKAMDALVKRRYDARDQGCLEAHGGTPCSSTSPTRSLTTARTGKKKRELVACTSKVGSSCSPSRVPGGSTRWPWPTRSRGTGRSRRGSCTRWRAVHTITGYICNRSKDDYCTEDYADRIFAEVNRIDVPFSTEDLGSREKKLRPAIADFIGDLVGVIAVGNVVVGAASRSTIRAVASGAHAANRGGKPLTEQAAEPVGQNAGRHRVTLRSPSRQMEVDLAGGHSNCQKISRTTET